jgi:cellulose synthase/poly-beta-1,6-N-acetylglucosamine synthase-like glycosyltransferase
VLFLVESRADPAWDVLNHILADTLTTPASLIVAGHAEGCSQKIHNLLTGLAHVDPRTTTLVFVDSDVQVHALWLKALVTPLKQPSIGATSGFRWYAPLAGNLAGSLRSAWNAATLSLMVHPRYGFAWGGSTAIRREAFERLKVREAWSHGLSDDWLLTQAVRAAGLTIQFVPACLVPTREPCTWRQLVEWTTRQVTITRVYAPRTWRVALLLHGLYLALGLLGLIALSTGQWVSAGLFLSHWGLSGLSNMVVCLAALRRLAAHGFVIAQRAWPQALWAVAVTALSLLDLALSLTTRTITWRGIAYTMLSPQQVVVHRHSYVPATSSPPSLPLEADKGG